jgi:hypothetical protein
VLLSICIVVIGFVHAQYGILNASIAYSDEMTELFFGIANGDIDPKKLEWKTDSDDFLPKFLRLKLEQEKRKYHKFKFIQPFKIFSWFFQVLQSIIINGTKSQKNHLKPKKIHLIESSLYSLIIWSFLKKIHADRLMS